MGSFVGELPWRLLRDFHPCLPLQLSFTPLRVLNPSSIDSTVWSLCRWQTNNAMSFIVSQLTMVFLPLLTLILSLNARAQVTFVPPALPLAVRSPYLNCWLFNGTGALFGQTWPTTFNHSQVCHP